MNSTREKTHQSDSRKTKKKWKLWGLPWAWDEDLRYPFFEILKKWEPSMNTRNIQMGLVVLKGKTRDFPGIYQSKAFGFSLGEITFGN